MDKRYVLFLLFFVFAGCIESTMSESKAIEISSETEEVKYLLENDPLAYFEVEEAEFQGKDCWVISWFSEKSLHYPDAPVHTVYIDKQSGEILDIFTTKQFDISG